MHGDEAAQTEIDGMAKRKHPALAQEHVIGQREYDHDTHFARHGEHEA